MSVLKFTRILLVQAGVTFLFDLVILSALSTHPAVGIHTPQLPNFTRTRGAWEERSKKVGEELA